VLLSAFGISNWLTGMLFILIALKAKALADAALLLILVAYAVGWLGMQYAGVSPNADFYGRYFMFVYFGVCVLGLVLSHYEKKRARAGNP